MLPYAFFLIALLCAGVTAQEDSDEHEKYLEECKQLHPDATEMEVYLYQEYFCAYLCMGKNDTERYIGGMQNKVDKTPCRTVFVTEDAPYECFNGQCSRAEDVQLCKDQPLVGDLKSVSAKECVLTCKADQELKTFKPDGTYCNPKDRLYQAGKCIQDSTNVPMCSEERTFVEDPKGRSPPNQTVFEDLCRQQNQNYTSAFPLNYNNKRKVNMCEFACFAPVTDMDFTVLSIDNGVVCDDGMVCRGGLCTESVDIKTCETPLNGAVDRLEYEGCEINCKGAERQVKVEMEVGRTCTIKKDGWNDQKGTCNAQRKCTKKRKH